VLIWLAGARFSFTHMLPVSTALYILAGSGLVALLDLRGKKPVLAWLLLLIPVVWTAHIARNDLRYVLRPTRLEMGADIESACRFLGETMEPGDVVVTCYDKYFTAFSFYCGPTLHPGKSVLVPDRPQSDWVVGFNHLFAQPGESLVRPDQVSTLDALESSAHPSVIYLVIPYFEMIEGQFSETVGWLHESSLYGPAEGPGPEALKGWRIARFPLVKVAWRTTTEAGPLLKSEIKRIIASERPLK